MEIYHSVAAHGRSGFLPRPLGGSSDTCLTIQAPDGCLSGPGIGGDAMESVERQGEHVGESLVV